MPIGTFSPGPYTATWAGASGQPGGAGALDVGLVEGVDRFQRTAEAQDIRVDAYGETVVDGVYRGGQMFVLMTFKEWTDTVKALLWPFGGTQVSPDFGAVGPVGSLMTNLAGILVLTAVTGTPAATNGPATINFGSAIISPGHNSEVILGSEERNVPVVFRCYPYDNSGTLVWFTET